jgi:hypothetical protein
MGRHKLHKTPNQIAEQKLRWWGPARNKRRRNRYATDKLYRERVHRWGRTSYQKRSKPKLRNSGANLAKLNQIGSLRIVSANGNRKRVITFSNAELATLLGYHPIVIRRWHTDRRFPRPSLRAKRSKNVFGVYTKNQAEELLKIMSEHQKKKLYLQKSDAETIAKLFKAVAASNRS